MPTGTPIFPPSFSTTLGGIYGELYNQPEANANISNIYGKLQTGINVLPPTLTKGTQGSTGFSVQALKDAGRTTIIFSAIGVASGTTGTETAITLTKSSGTAATTTGTSFVVTNGKTFRITQVFFSVKGNDVATAQTTTFNFRINTAGAVTTSSTPILFSTRVATVAVAGDYQTVSMAIPDGMEIYGDGTLQIGVTAAATFTTNAPTWDVTIFGYEY